jgi:hypothetical protein
MIGGQMRHFINQVLELADKTGSFKIHFVSAREAFNIAMAAVDGKTGDPHQFRDYRLKQIMREGIRQPAEYRRDSSLVIR